MWYTDVEFTFYDFYIVTILMYFTTISIYSFVFDILPF